jgi:hypothetical protein
LLVNVTHLKRLMFRSKSCVNGCFQRLGYEICRPASNPAELLTQMIPGTAPNMFAPSQWSARRATAEATVLFMPNTSIDIATSGPAPSQPSSPDAFAETGMCFPRVSRQFDIQNLLNHGTPPQTAVSPQTR